MMNASRRIALALLLSMPASSAWAIYCFDFQSNNQMCLQMKTKALVTMMKLQNDPRFLTWTSEGQPGTKAAKEADRVMKMAQSCLTLIDCGMAATESQKLISTIPQFVKGDLGDFAGQIWYGADMPHGGLDQMFDNNQKTAELPNDNHLQIGDNFTQSGQVGFDAASAAPDAVSLASASGSRSGASGGSSSVGPGAAAGAGFSSGAGPGASAGISGADGSLRTQSNGVQYDGQNGPAEGSWQSSGSSFTGGGGGGDSGSVNLPSEMDQRVGSAVSDDAAGVSEGESDDGQSASPAKFTRIASSALNDGRKKSTVDLNQAIDADQRTRADSNSSVPDPSISDSDLTSMIP